MTTDTCWLLLGASRGLGESFARGLSLRRLDHAVYSRQISAFDANKTETWPTWIETWAEQKPTHLVYFAGGGPYGNYAARQMKDHLWAFRVNFEFPAFLLHQVLNQKIPSLRQICFIGSAIAESKADPQAASYASAKHALLGLVSSLQKEEHPGLDIRIFSPGYMDTGLLPLNAWPRQKPGLVKSVDEVSEALWLWLQDPAFADKHQVFE